ncbi:MAG: acyltransferase family protein [Cytophagales bacterium]
MKLSFKRITSSGNFIPEIDGLRFIAIASVVLYHLSGFITTKDLNEYVDTINYSFLEHFLSHGHLGVPLFFTISGFILGMPFAKFHVTKENRISIKQSFLSD